MKLKQIILAGLACIVAMPLLALDRDATIARIKPVGEVQIAGDESTKIEVKDADSSADAAPAAMTGEQVYNKHCVVCHSAGVAGAPKTHDKASWGLREEKGIDALLASAIKGVNAMPPKGTCMNCSDAEIKSAIEYMLPK
ncbi:MAG: c-type cytochrome [Amylibacter sp.]|nr:c-type cytochrome [Amylibacter sp.]